MMRMIVSLLIAAIVFGVQDDCAALDDGYAYGRKITLDNDAISLNYVGSVKRPKFTAYWWKPNAKVGRPDKLVKIPLGLMQFKNKYLPDSTVVAVKGKIDLVDRKLYKALRKDNLLTEMRDSAFQVDSRIVHVDFKQGKYYGQIDVFQFAMTPPVIVADSTRVFIGDDEQPYLLIRLKNSGTRPKVWLEYRKINANGKATIKRTSVQDMSAKYHKLPVNIRRVLGIAFALKNPDDAYHVFKLSKKLLDVERPLVFAIDNGNGMDAVELSLPTKSD